MVAALRLLRLLLAAFGAFAVLALAPAAKAETSQAPPPTVEDFKDAAEDGPAPDIVSVSLARLEDPAALSFSVSLANRPQGLDAREVVVLVLDLDRDQTTGCRGFEVTLALTKDGARFGRCLRGAYDYDDAPDGFAGKLEEGLVSFIVPLAALEALGYSGGVNLQAGSVAVFEERHYDDAPDVGHWHWSSDGAPFVDVKAPVLQVLKAQGRVGKALKLRFRLGDDSGKAALRLEVYAGKRRRLLRDYPAFIVSGDVHYIAFRTQSAFRGRFCLTAEDAAGNERRACAPLLVRPA